MDTRMTPAEQQLVQRIFASKHFAFADTLKRIVDYLCRNAAGADSQSIKEYEIAVSAIGRPESFDPKIDPVVRVSMSSIRERLRAYFALEGRGESLELSIPKGRYQAIFSPRVPEAVALPGTDTDRRALQRFWAAHRAPGSMNLVTYTEPLFYRDDATMTYFRNVYVNDRADGEGELRRRSPVPAGVDLRPCYHYLSSGEMQASISLARLFHELGLPLEMRNARQATVNEIRHANLILLGSVRTNPLVDALLGTQAFTMTPETIDNLQPRDGEQATYRGSAYFDGKLRRCRDFVLVTRRPGLVPGTAMTIIASHHGRAVQGVGNLLTIEHEVAALLTAMGVAEGAAAPDHFQALLEVEMIDLGDEVVSARYVTHRTGATPPVA
jgi:hypothetical protein